MTEEANVERETVNLALKSSSNREKWARKVDNEAKLISVGGMRFKEGALVD